MTAGRPSDYKKDYNEQVYKLGLLGATDEEMASFFEIAKSTFNNWKKKYPEFMDSIKRGKDIANANVAESLYKRALGYEHKDEKVFCSDGGIVTHETIKHYPPDTGAAMAWLKNRTRHLQKPWSDKTELEVSGDISFAESLKEARNRARE